MTAAARRGYVNFFVEYGGKTKRCRVTETALLNDVGARHFSTSSRIFDLNGDARHRRCRLSVVGNSYPFKIGTKLGDSVSPDYRPDGGVRPGHLSGLQNRTSDSHSNAGKIACRCKDRKYTQCQSGGDASHPGH
jgi:hypothetical protein